MKSIKAYLLLLFLPIFFSVQSFSQSSFNENEKEEQKKEFQFSKSDSLLAATYFTEKDYNEINGIEQLERAENTEGYYNDEVYNSEQPHKQKNRRSFWDAVAAEVIVEVMVNTVFIIATFWQ